jgi:hypothetical protein
MDPKELIGLVEAYQEVYASQEEIEEASYSAKAARAGKDIGKPGKAFAKIAKEAGKRYGSKERGEKVAGAVLVKLRAEDVEIDEAVKGADPEMRKAAAAERRAGDKRLSPSKGKGYAAHAMQQAAYVDKLTKGKHLPGMAHEEVEIFDVVLEFLQAEGYAETLEEAEKMMATVLDVEAIEIIVGEGYQRNPEKGEKEDKKYAPVRGEKTPMPPRGDKRREDFEKWYAANVR